MRMMQKRNTKYSRKREAIRKLLLSTKAHPSAEQIYSDLKNEIPDLSLATVYRNLREMKESGEIQLVAVVDGKERYDGVAERHTHFICDECGRIDDIDFGIEEQKIDKLAAELSLGEIEYHTLCFHGQCRGCKDKLAAHSAQ